jgi:hypothetical protein
MDAAVVSAAGQRSAIRNKRQLANGRRLLGKRFQLPVAEHIPQPDSAVIPRKGARAAVAGEGQGIDEFGRNGNADAFCADGGVPKSDRPVVGAGSN